MSKKCKKLVSIILVALIAVLSTGVLAACGKKKLQARDENVVQISYTLAGYGDEWIEIAVDMFNEAYADKGYSAVIDRSDAGFQYENVMQEIKYPDTNPYDLYITIAENIVPKLIDSSYSVLKSRDEALLEDLSDLYASAPVALDGSEESGTVSSTRSASTLFYNNYISEGSQFNGKTYSYQWTCGQAGMAVNTKVLSDLGYTMPRTTKEMLAIFDDVLAKKAKASTGSTIYPVTWPGQNGGGYAAYSLYTWMAQYMGLEEYNDFFAMKPKTGTTFDNGYDVYDNVGILYALKAMETFMDQKYAVEGSVTTINHLLSDQILADGEAVFSFNGSWNYNELIGIGYEDAELSGLEMMPLPVLSEVADKIGLAGSVDEKDAKLSAIVKGIDDGMTDAQIATAQGVTAEQVATVREARGMYYDLGLTHQAIIPSYSNAKGAAKEFLRFIVPFKMPAFPICQNSRESNFIEYFKFSKNKKNWNY
ncbi:MAG: hypothetical protein MJ193_01580 [Clostridia bacterium]|nr:hypothetical protein [Clostridia bacterium]